MKLLLLTGGSALALALAAGTAEGATVAFTTPGYTAWTAPATGLYQVDVWGAQVAEPTSAMPTAPWEGSAPASGSR